MKNGPDNLDQEVLKDLADLMQSQTPRVQPPANIEQVAVKMQVAKSAMQNLNFLEKELREKLEKPQLNKILLEKGIQDLERIINGDSEVLSLINYPVIYTYISSIKMQNGQIKEINKPLHNSKNYISITSWTSFGDCTEFSELLTKKAKEVLTQWKKELHELEELHNQQLKPIQDQIQYYRDFIDKLVG